MIVDVLIVFGMGGVVVLVTWALLKRPSGSRLPPVDGDQNDAGWQS